MFSPVTKTGLMGSATLCIAVGVSVVYGNPEQIGGYALTGLGVLMLLVKYINTNADKSSEE